MSLKGSPTLYDFTSFKFARVVLIAQNMVDINEFLCIIMCNVHIDWNIPYMPVKTILRVVLFRSTVSLQNFL